MKVAPQTSLVDCFDSVFLKSLLNPASKRWNTHVKVNLTQRCLSLVHTRYHPVVQWLNPEQGVSTEEGKKSSPTISGCQ